EGFEGSLANWRPISSTLSLRDGGTTGDGIPYIVLEYIEGVWITEYCRARNLSVRERLRLFLPVCSAADYAHRHFVVHRDIK
ncbi:MAG TPA: hypothetical protein DEH78_22695, partial [Solibacterales bacterium]|nr:hypothetical protein [Bryobacterales bacterium]